MPDEHLERLLAELGERAKAEIAQVQTDAAARAESVRTGRAERANARRAEAVAALEAEFTHRRASSLAEARRRARGVVLCAQHRLVDRVLDKIRLRAAERLAEPASACGKERRAALLRSYAIGADASIECVESGIRLTADGGHLSIDDTVDAWLEADRAAIAIDVCLAVEKSSC